NVADYQESQTAENDQDTGDHIQKHIIPVRDQVLKSSQNIEARVVKGRDRMEDTDTQCMYRRIILYKYDKTQHCAGALETKGRKKHRLDQFNDTLITVDVQRLADHDSGLYADTLLDRKHESHAHRSHSQTSDLDQRRNDALTEGGEMIRCVNRDQTSHTDRAGRCEQRVNGSYRYAVPYRYRQEQDQGSQNDH